MPSRLVLTALLSLAGVVAVLASLVGHGPLAWPWAISAGLLGLAAGSLWTVVIERWPAGVSLRAPPSRCPPCGHRLRHREQVPIASWLALRGRCAGCGAAIPWRDPVIEVSSAMLAAGAVLAVGADARGAAVAVLLVALVPVVVIDLEHRLIPDVVVLPAAGAALALAIVAEPGRWWVPTAAALGASLFLGVLALVHPAGMGLGDAKLALLLGAVLGAAVIPALAFAFTAGALLGAVLLVRLGAGGRTLAVPFGPFLAAGAVAALVWGQPVVEWYGRALG